MGSFWDGPLHWWEWGFQKGISDEQTWKHGGITVRLPGCGSRVEGFLPPALYRAVWLDRMSFSSPLFAHIHLEARPSTLRHQTHMKQSDSIVLVRLFSGWKGKMLCIVQCAERTKFTSRHLSLSLAKFISSSQSPDFSSLPPLYRSRPFHFQSRLHIPLSKWKAS